MQPEKNTRLTLRFALKGGIWRRVEVPGALSLAGLNLVIQAAFRWYAQQTHYFMGANKQIFGKPGEGRTDWVDEQKVPTYLLLGVPGAALAYTYGPWAGMLLCEGVTPSDEVAPPTFLDGEGAAPAEKAAWTWAEDLEAWAESGEVPPPSPEDPTVEFDRAESERHFTAMFLPPIARRLDPEVQRLMNKTLEKVSFRYVLLGIDEEAAPPSDEEVAAATSLVREELRRIEAGDESPEGSRLRRAVQTLGLARVNRGELILTTTGRDLMDDPRGVGDVMVDKLPREQERAQREAAWLQLVQAAAGYGVTNWVSEQFVALGWRNTSGDLPGARHVFLLAESTMAVLLSVGGAEGERGRLRAKLATAALLVQPGS